MPGPPELTDEQRRQALAKAAQARRVRAEIKEQLKAGSLDLTSLLELADDDQIIAKMKVVSVLESLPRLGKVKSRRVMDEIGINGDRKSVV